jgi:hypothetical protein
MAKICCYICTPQAATIITLASHLLPLLELSVATSVATIGVCCGCFCSAAFLLLLRLHFVALSLCKFPQTGSRILGKRSPMAIRAYM